MSFGTYSEYSSTATPEVNELDYLEGLREILPHTDHLRANTPISHDVTEASERVDVIINGDTALSPYYYDTDIPTRYELGGF